MCTSSADKLQLDAQATAGVNTGKPGGLLRRLRRDKAGSVGMLFGLVVIPLTAFVGLAVDFGRVYAVKSQTQSALDAAALAAGRVAQVDKIDTLNKASAAATAYFNKAKPTSVVSSALRVLPRRRPDPVLGDGHFVDPDAVPRRAPCVDQQDGERRGTECLQGQLLRMRRADDDRHRRAVSEHVLHRHQQRRQQYRSLADARRHGLDVRPVHRRSTRSRRPPRT